MTKDKKYKGNRICRECMCFDCDRKKSRVQECKKARKEKEKGNK